MLEQFWSDLRVVLEQLWSDLRVVLEQEFSIRPSEPKILRLVLIEMKKYLNFSESRLVFAGCNPWHVIGSSCHYR